MKKKEGFFRKAHFKSKFIGEVKMENGVRTKLNNNNYGLFDKLFFSPGGPLFSIPTRMSPIKLKWGLQMTQMPPTQMRTLHPYL